tara:strand:- start:279 stop:575 length:297 start_codon:yes stop_codon:yes gene_type:complete
MKEVHEERKIIVSAINDILETTWTEYEFKHGKEIDVPPSWRTHINYLIRKYKENAWIITRNIIISSEYPRARRDYLVFLNPMFLKVPHELRSVSIIGS